MTPTNNKLKVQDIEISLATIDNQDYISLTDMAKSKNDKVQDVEINIRVINEADYISLIPPNSGELKMKQGLIASIVLKNVLKF